MSSICNNNNVTLIDLNEAIGQSLYTLNNNFSNIKNDLCQIDTNLQTLKDLYTAVSTIANNLSAQKNNIIKARVSFDCTRNEAGLLNSSATPRFIYPNTSFNITTVQRLIAPDRYSINFQTPFLNANSYGIIGTNSLTPSDSWVQPLSGSYGTSSVSISIMNRVGTTEHPEYVSIIII